MRIDARDVLDANAITRRAFRGRIVGHFARTGPNAWDDYAYVPEEGDDVAVYPGIRVQLERLGADFRMRRAGRVFRVRWLPDADDRAQLGGTAPSELRARFVARYLELPDKGVIGAAGVIASKLRG